MDHPVFYIKAKCFEFLTKMDFISHVTAISFAQMLLVKTFFFVKVYKFNWGKL